MPRALERSRTQPEYELIDTGVFDDDRYFDVFVEYAKQSPEELLIQIKICNRGSEACELHVLPRWWFRNTWSWERRLPDGNRERPSLRTEFYADIGAPSFSQDELWDEEDGFFYDVLHLPNGQAMRLEVRSMVGLLPPLSSR